MFKHASIILFFLFKSKERKRDHIGNILNYFWEKEIAGTNYETWMIQKSLISTV